jgi:membrane-bound ClpP family serine protease
MRLLLFIVLTASVPMLALLAYIIHSSRQQKNSRSPLNLVGRVASIERSLDPEGFVLIEGELWRARVRGAACVERGDARVRVVGASGCVLEVEPLG